MPYKDIEARRKSAREAMQRSRDKLKATRAIAQLVCEAPLGPIRNDTVTHAVSALAGLMVERGLTSTRIIDKVNQMIDCKSVKTIAGEREIVEDNDAQLKATEMAMELQTRAGLLPSDKQHNGAGNITLNVISYHSLEPQIITIEQPTDNRQDS